MENNEFVKKNWSWIILPSTWREFTLYTRNMLSLRFIYNSTSSYNSYWNLSTIKKYLLLRTRGTTQIAQKESKRLRTEEMGQTTTTTTVSKLMSDKTTTVILQWRSMVADFVAPNSDVLSRGDLFAIVTYTKLQTAKTFLDERNMDDVTNCQVQHQLCCKRLGAIERLMHQRLDDCRASSNGCKGGWFDPNIIRLTGSISHLVI